MKSLSKFLVFALAVLGANTVCAQASLKGDEANKKAEVKELINGKRYTFEATKMVSKKGDSYAIKPGTDLDISKDTLIAYLPEVGKRKASRLRLLMQALPVPILAIQKNKAKMGVGT